MNRTVYCTFDQRDLADIAMGKLRAAVPGVKAVSYVDAGLNSGYDGGYNNTGQRGAYFGAVGYGNIFPAIPTAFANTAIRPARPVTVKIVCDEGSQKKVTSKLINLRAYRIVAV